jgi:hypothetical protein
MTRKLFLLSLSSRNEIFREIAEDNPISANLRQKLKETIEKKPNQRRKVCKKGKKKRGEGAHTCMWRADVLLRSIIRSMLMAIFLRGGKSLRDLGRPSTAVRQHNPAQFTS